MITMTKMEVKDKFGGYNEFPPNFQPATEDEFWNKFCCYNYDYTENRQMFREIGSQERTSKMVHAKLFFYADGTGLALVYQAKGARYIAPALCKFALCWHRNKTAVEQSNCYTVSVCNDCGHRSAIDSSD